MFARTDDIVTHYVAEGPPRAPTLLMLHSLGTTLHVWDAQAAVLSRQFRVIRPDLRGHGLSGVTPGPGSMERFARDALALLDALGENEVHVAGISIGGRIAMELAALAPERVASLILVDTALEFLPPESWEGRAATVRAEGMASVADAVMARWVIDQTRPDSFGLRQMLLTTPPEGYAAAAEALRDARADSLRGRLHCPTTVIVGELDQASPVSAAKAIQAAIPESALVVIRNGAHIPTFECAEAVTDAILAHLLPERAPGMAAAAGMAVRRAVLGGAHVDRSMANMTPFDKPFVDFILEGVWGRVWTRPGLPRHTRSLLTLGLMAALGHHEEFKLHVRATENTGVTADELSEVLLQVAAYAGVPAANSALRIAKETYREMQG
ncbi:4-carboxymuconolactone decarboxylase [Roseomonas sp. NAR14]|uniref:4-carboxymuconolactone decarboxylase n=1 Tax=Roseomonas acroporae TaxID=2937791 RepID=A0A9X1YAU1_9PROT|nr:4-carboxymuconolactone decarboxylase [Roseomonas acroporae]MCK8786322.1 4-carboxymuconolactone decarboxylase [Roseomonas acroporae]